MRPLHKVLLGALQRGKGLEDFAYLDGHYLLSLDGTGYFSSKKVHCAQCGEKHHRDGTITYNYHQMLGAVLVHPDFKEVFPLAPEPILKQDSAKKNDCDVHHRFRYLNGAPRNDANFEFEVNFLEYWETAPGGKVQHFSWVTNIPLQCLMCLYVSNKSLQANDVMSGTNNVPDLQLITGRHPHSSQAARGCRPTAPRVYQS